MRTRQCRFPTDGYSGTVVVRWLTPRYATNLQPVQAGFVCVDAVSTAVSSILLFCFQPLPPFAANYIYNSHYN